MSDIRLKKITVEPLESPLIIQNGDVSILNTTISNSILNGSLVSNGGISINNDYEASSMSAGGALTVGGGVGIMKSIYIGKNLNMDTSNGLIVVGGVTENRMYLDNIINKHFYISPDGINRRFDLYDSKLYINITTSSLNSSTGALCVEGGISINTTENVTDSLNGGALTVAGGVGIGKNLRVNGNTIISESLTTGSLAVQNINATNITVSNNIINNAVITNAVTTNITSSGIIVTNMVSTNETTSNLINTAFTSGGAVITNANVTTSTISTLLNTNAVSTNVSVGTIVASTLLSAIGNSNTVGNIFTTGGNVGIGITNPATDLHLGTGNTFNNILFEPGYTSDGGNPGFAAINFNGYYNSGEQRINSNKNRWRIITDQRASEDSMAFDTFNGTTLTTLMSFATSGNVSIPNLVNTNFISTNISSATLNVSSQARISGPGGVGSNGSVLITGGDSYGHSLYIASVSSQKRLVFNNNGTNGNIFAYDYGSSQSKDLELQGPGGNVGIGTNNPGERLDVRGNLRVGSSTVGNYISFHGTFGDEPDNYNHTYIGERIYSGTENSELLLFKGNDTSGLSGPDNIRLLAANLRFDTYTSVLSGSFETVAAGGTTRMLIDQNGNVGIGTTSPSNTLDISGTGRITISITTGALYATNITSTNIVGTNLTASNLNLTNAEVTNATITNSTITNVINSNLLNTALTSGGARITNDIYIGGDEYIYGVTNYTSDSDSVINLYDASNFRRFSLNKNLSSHDFSISRYNSLGDELEKPFNISYSTGAITFNNTIVSSSILSAAIVVKGGISIQTSRSAQSESDGGALTIAGGIGIGSNMYIGGDVFMKSTTESVDVSTGSLIIKGGVAISKNLNVLGNTLIVGNLTVNGLTTSIDTTNTVIKDNLLILNSAPAGSNDSGIIINRYQQDNDTASGDIVNATDPLIMTIPSQIGLTSTQVKLHSSASASDNYYDGWWIKVTSGFSNNQVRKITSYSGSTKIATISSSWTTQNPSGGDYVYIYNKPIVGIIFNELNDRFEFGSTIQDPGKTNVSFTDYMSITFASASSVSTSGSSSATSGSILIAGGIGISNSTDAQSITNGGTFTTLGGASIGKTLYCQTLNANGVNMTPNGGDIFTSISFNASNNQSVASNITGLSFSSSVWGFDCYLTARVVATANLYTNFHIRGINKGTTWEIIKTYVGDDTGIEFYITTDGQLQYTTQNINGFVSCIFKARALVN
jgi:hypothetical protein